MSTNDLPARSAHPLQERARIEAVRDLGLLDTAPEDRFDRVVELAQKVFGVSMAAVNLVDAERAFTKAAVGMATSHSIPRRESMCSVTVTSDEVLVVPDLGDDERFADFEIRETEGVRFYAGAPLRDAGGERVGALCLLDRAPREMDGDARIVLRHLADWVERELITTADLQQGRELQRRLLPRRLPDLDGWDLAGACDQARMVGGDFFDWQIVGRDDQRSLQVLLADVMGKGLPAALQAAGVRAMIRGASRHLSLSGTLARIAGDMGEDLQEMGSFVTLSAARIRVADGDFEYVDAGHGLAFAIGLGGARSLQSDGLPLGLGLDEGWTAEPGHLSPGEALVIVSDGIFDVLPDHAALGAEAAAAWSNTDTAEEMVRILSRRASELGATDDVTIVVARRRH